MRRIFQITTKGPAWNADPSVTTDSASALVSHRSSFRRESSEMPRLQGLPAGRRDGFRFVAWRGLFRLAALAVETGPPAEGDSEIRPVDDGAGTDPQDSGPSPLRSAAFRRLATAYTINEFGNWIGDVALAILVYDRTGSALATAGLFLALRFAPAFLGPLLTSRAEALPARRAIPAIHLLEGLIFLALAWLATHFSLPAALILGAIDGTLAIGAAALTRGATAALLLSDGSLRRGNAILNVGFSAGGALGPALAGVLVAALGPGSALVVDAVTFLVVATILASTRELRLDTSQEHSWRERLKAGIGEAWAHAGIRRLLIAQSGALILFSLVIPIEVVYAKHTLHAGDAGYGALLATWGAGMVLGGLAFAAANRVRLLLVLAVSTTLIAIGYGGIAVSDTLVLACVFSAIGGAGNGVQWIAFVTAIQHGISATAQSSVMSLVGAINQAMPAIGFLLGGVIATIGSPRTTYAAAAIGVVVAIVLVAMRPPRGLDASAPVEAPAVAEPVSQI
jgi:MFS family permease